MTFQQVQKFVVNTIKGAFTNKKTLDKLSTSDDGNLLFDGNEIKGGMGSSENITIDIDSLLDNETKEVISNETPVGTIISHMGNTAPDHYLICDGAEYQISKYQELANFFKKEFGSINYFGGNGTTTFAVPDLRGEFLRGTGTNSHENGGAGTDVGVHQTPTQVPYMGVNTTTSYTVWTLTDGHMNGDTGIAPINYDVRVNSIGDTGKGLATATNSMKSGTWTSSSAAGEYTVRPTNTSVLYCIKYESTYSVSISSDKDIFNFGVNIYSEEEKVIGKWINGKPIYRKVTNKFTNFDFETTHPRTSTKDSVIYTYTFNENGIYVLSNLQGHTECINNEGYYNFYLNSDLIGKLYVKSGSSYTSLIDAQDIKFKANENDVLSIKINWDGSHSNNVWGIKGNISFLDDVDVFIRKDSVNNIYEYTKTADKENSFIPDMLKENLVELFDGNSSCNEELTDADILNIANEIITEWESDYNESSTS